MGATTVQGKVFDKTRDHIINWDAFHDISQMFKNLRGNISQKARETATEIASIVVDSEKHYFAAAQSTYEWCGESIPLFERYMKLVTESGINNITAQKEALENALYTGILKLDIAEVQINLSNTKFNITTNLLRSLDILLVIDDDEDSYSFRDYIPPAMYKIKTARNELIREIVSISSLHEQAKETELSVKNNAVVEIVNCAIDLVDQCVAYRRKHSGA